VSTTALEVYGRGFGWSWRLRVEGDVVATHGHHYDESREARISAKRLREAVAFLEGDRDAFDPEEGGYPRIVFEQDPTPEGELPEDRESWVWKIETTEKVLAHSAERFKRKGEAEDSFEWFLEHITDTPMIMVGAQTNWKGGPRSVGVGRPSITGFVSELLRGYRHRKNLERVDTRIVVSGIRGKSSTARRLDDILNERGYDTLTKITGNRPYLVHNGEVHPIQRSGPRVTLYENISLINEFFPEMDAYQPEDFGVFENQGITEYTTRFINRRLVKPQVVLLTNVRQDHADTLGESREDIARAFARSIPSGTHVVSGEQHPVIHEYLTESIERRGATIEQVDVPGRHEGMIGAETVHALNDVLEAVDEPPVPDEKVDEYLRETQPEWTQLPNGKVFNAAEVNDVESTEMVRERLAGDDRVTPFVYLRWDRRGRTASFVRYMNMLVERDLIEEVHVGGANTSTFARSVDCPVTQHPEDADADYVLDQLLYTGYPVVIMGNTVADLMRETQDEIDDRAEEWEQKETDQKDEFAERFTDPLSNPPNPEGADGPEGNET
jgi:hypothetical protein